MTDLITRAKEALEGATPGPWGKRPHWSDEDMREVAPLYDGLPDIGEWSAIADVYGHGEEESAQAEANAALIALAPDLARALIAADELAEAVAALDKQKPGKDGGRLVLEADILRALEALATYRAAVEGKANE